MKYIIKHSNSIIGNNGIILTITGEEPDPTEIIIDSKSYNVKRMPDGKLWMIENLDYKVPGATYQTKRMYANSTPQICHYGFNTGSKDGIMYNMDAVNLLKTDLLTTCPGWHIATDSEWSNLQTAVGENPGKKLKAKKRMVNAGN